MNLKRLLCIALALCLMLCLCACGNADNNDAADDTSDAAAQPDDNAADAADNASDDVSDDEASDDASDEAPAGVVYTVTVVDEGGNPVAGTMVQICQGELCLMPCATDDSGVATFTATEEGAYEAKLLALPAGYEYATEEQVFHFDGAMELTITLKAVA